MKKTLIASAVAAAALSTSAFAMDPASELAAKLDSMPTIYGNIQLAAAYGDDKTDSNYSMFDNGSTIGFKHSHEIAPGVTGFFKAEFEFNAAQKQGANTDGSNGGLDETDETYIGVKGDFGQVWAGQNDTLYEDWIDVTDWYEATAAYVDGNLTPTGEERIVQYTSPSMAGFTAGVAVQINGEGVNGNNHRNGVVAGVKYSLDALTVALVADTADGAAGENTALGLSATYEMDNVGVAFQYETQEDTVDLYSLLGTYSMGANTFALSYSMNDYDSNHATKADVEANTVSVQALHNLSDHMYVYVEGTMVDQDNGATDFNGVALGATYAF